MSACLFGALLPGTPSAAGRTETASEYAATNASYTVYIQLHFHALRTTESLPCLTYLRLYRMIRTDHGRDGEVEMPRMK